jgi:hypothetical protein
MNSSYIHPHNKITQLTMASISKQSAVLSAEKVKESWWQVILNKMQFWTLNSDSEVMFIILLK